ncbi:MAG: serine/threonine protein kinase [Bryobacterales bacterium]|nr:serine/threonine protein kinase [Bryobacterales bacterium]
MSHLSLHLRLAMDRIGRYEIVSELGRGAMGIVYRAHDTRIARDVAIKTIKLADQVAPDEMQGLRERLFREAQSAGRLSHPGIVTIYDIAEENGIAYITMEFVEGRTLEELMNAGEVGDLKAVAQLVDQMAGALDYAHAREIVHRDTKPSNILVTPDGHTKITDFGIARIESSQMTQTGTVMGTPSYMSPEQVRGESIDGRSDQFSLAVMAYELVTGRKPFIGDGLTDVIFKIVSEKPEPPSAINTALPTELDRIILKGLAKRPDERFRDCHAFAAEFNACLAGYETASTMGSAATRTTLREPSSNIVSTLDKTAPISGTSTVKSGEKQESVLADPTEAHKLPPLRSRAATGDGGAPSSQDEPSPRRRRARFVLVASLATILGVAATAIAMNPWLLDDPVGLLGLVAADILEQVESTPEKDAGAPSEPETRISSLSKSAPAISRGALGQVQSTAQSLDNPAVVKEVEEPSPPPPEEPSETEEEAEAVEKTLPARPDAPSSVVVSFAGQPGGATVVVDQSEEWTCTSPCNVEVPPGDHAANITLDGYFPHRRAFTVDSDPLKVHFSLEEILGTLNVTTEPSGAAIYVNGKKRPETTPGRIKLPPGKHVVRVESKGKTPLQRTIEIEPNTLRSIRFAWGR